MDQASDEISFKELILQIKGWYHYLLSKWVLLLVTGLLGATIGVVYAWLQKPIYTATVTYALDDEKSGGGISGALGLASSLGFDLGGGNSSGVFSAANLMELMHSKSLIEKTLLSSAIVDGTKITLAEDYIEINGIRKAWVNSPELIKLHFPVDANKEQFTRTQDSVLAIIYENIDKSQLSITQKDKKVSIGTIEVKSINENFAKLFCEALVREVTDFYVETRSRKSRNNVNILQKQTDSVRAELNAAITGVAAANDNNFNVNPVQSVHKTPAAKRQVDVQANTAILTQLVANLEMSKVALLKETPLIQVIDKPIFPLKKEKMGKFKSLIIGGFLGGFITILILVFRRIGKSIME